jgi:hypothetical protein
VSAPITKPGHETWTDYPTEIVEVPGPQGPPGPAADLVDVYDALNDERSERALADQEPVDYTRLADELKPSLTPSVDLVETLRALGYTVGKAAPGETSLPFDPSSFLGGDVPTWDGVAGKLVGGSGGTNLGWHNVADYARKLGYPSDALDFGIGVDARPAFWAACNDAQDKIEAGAGDQYVYCGPLLLDFIGTWTNGGIAPGSLSVGSPMVPLRPFLPAKLIVVFDGTIVRANPQCSRFSQNYRTDNSVVPWDVWQNLVIQGNVYFDWGTFVTYADGTTRGESLIFGNARTTGAGSGSAYGNAFWQSCKAHYIDSGATVVSIAPPAGGTSGNPVTGKNWQLKHIGVLEQSSYGPTFAVVTPEEAYGTEILVDEIDVKRGARLIARGGHLAYHVGARGAGADQTSEHVHINAGRASNARAKKCHVDYLDWEHTGDQPYLNYAHGFMQIGANGLFEEFTAGYLRGKDGADILCELDNLVYGKIDRMELIDCWSGALTWPNVVAPDPWIAKLTGQREPDYSREQEIHVGDLTVRRTKEYYSSGRFRGQWQSGMVLLNNEVVYASNGKPMRYTGGAGPFTSNTDPNSDGANFTYATPAGFISGIRGYFYPTASSALGKLVVDHYQFISTNPVLLPGNSSSAINIEGACRDFEVGTFEYVHTGWTHYAGTTETQVAFRSLQGTGGGTRFRIGRMNYTIDGICDGAGSSVNYSLGYLCGNYAKFEIENVTKHRLNVKARNGASNHFQYRDWDIGPNSGTNTDKMSTATVVTDPAVASTASWLKDWIEITPGMKADVDLTGTTSDGQLVFARNLNRPKAAMQLGNRHMINGYAFGRWLTGDSPNGQRFWTVMKAISAFGIVQSDVVVAGDGTATLALDDASGLLDTGAQPWAGIGLGLSGGAIGEVYLHTGLPLARTGLLAGQPLGTSLTVGYTRAPGSNNVTIMGAPAGSRIVKGTIVRGFVSMVEAWLQIAVDGLSATLGVDTLLRGTRRTVVSTAVPGSALPAGAGYALSVRVADIDGWVRADLFSNPSTPLITSDPVAAGNAWTRWAPLNAAETAVLGNDRNPVPGWAGVGALAIAPNVQFDYYEAGPFNLLHGLRFSRQSSHAAPTPGTITGVGFGQESVARFFQGPGRGKTFVAQCRILGDVIFDQPDYSKLTPNMPVSQVRAYSLQNNDHPGRIIERNPIRQTDRFTSVKLAPTAGAPTLGAPQVTLPTSGTTPGAIRSNQLTEGYYRAGPMPEVLSVGPGCAILRFGALSLPAIVGGTPSANSTDGLVPWSMTTADVALGAGPFSVPVLDTSPFGAGDPGLGGLLIAINADTNAITALTYTGRDVGSGAGNITGAGGGSGTLPARSIVMPVDVKQTAVGLATFVTAAVTIPTTAGGITVPALNVSGWPSTSASATAVGLKSSSAGKTFTWTGKTGNTQINGAQVSTGSQVLAVGDIIALLSTNVEAIDIAIDPNELVGIFYVSGTPPSIRAVTAR